MPQRLPTPGTHRLFVCLLADAPRRQAIERLRTDWHWPSRRWWTEPDRLHVTVADPLYFTPAEQSRLQAALQRLRFAPFALALTRASVGPRTLSLQVAHSSSFSALQRQVKELAGQADAPFQRLPRAHVTLSRDAHGASVPPLARPIHWPVAQVCRVWSQLTADVGCRHYEVLARYEADSALQQLEPQQLGFGF